MTSNKPYLIRAFYQWIVDNMCTPYLVVDANVTGVMVPPQSIVEGKVILNINPEAVAQLDLGNDSISFSARFGGQSHRVWIPVGAVIAIYARENGAGTVFTVENEDSENELDTDNEANTVEIAQEKPPVKSKGAHLKVIK